MKLLSSSIVRRDKTVKADENRLARLKIKVREEQEAKKLSELRDNWDEEEKKRWQRFCQFNQEIQQRKALLIREIEELEHKKEVLIENLRIYTQ